MNILKSIGAVIAGILFGAILSIVTDIILEKVGIFSSPTDPSAFLPWMAAVALLYRAIYTVGSGYVTAALAPQNPMRHAIILGSIGLVVTALGSYANWDKVTPSTAWYPIALTLVSLPCSWFGGKLKTRA